jgi:hypothetical protein
MLGLSNGVNLITILRGQGSTKPTVHLPPKQMRALPFLIFLGPRQGGMEVLPYHQD